jgi:hypothetical protein
MKKILLFVSLIAQISCSQTAKQNSVLQTAISKYNVLSRREIANETFSKSEVCTDSRILEEISILTRQNPTWKSEECDIEASVFFKKVANWISSLNDFHASVSFPLQISTKVYPGIKSAQGLCIANTLLVRK